MKRNKTKRRILVGSIFLLLGLISSIAPNSVGGMVMTPNIYFVRACDPPYDLECVGEYEPLLGAGLYATESCVMEYSELGFYELFQGAAYASNGESLIAVASGTGSMWLADMYQAPCYRTHILWPFMVVRKDGNPIPAEHDPIPMALKYQVGLSGIGMFCSNAQLEVLTNVHP